MVELFPTVTKVTCLVPSAYFGDTSTFNLKGLRKGTNFNGNSLLQVLPEFLFIFFQLLF